MTATSIVLTALVGIALIVLTALVILRAAADRLQAMLAEAFEYDYRNDIDHEYRELLEEDA